ncbi:MAG TPA: energy transducer TonB [Candidatus Acidoferrum sp.]|jgi:TonB family protein
MLLNWNGNANLHRFQVIAMVNYRPIRIVISKRRVAAAIGSRGAQNSEVKSVNERRSVSQGLASIFVGVAVAILCSNSLSMWTLAQAQNAPTIDPTVVTLGDKLGKALEVAKVKKVLVADFRGPQGESHPAGTWLAEQLTASLQRDFPSLGIINRSQKAPSSSPPDSAEALEASRNWARQLKAKVIVSGTLEKVGENLQVTMFVIDVKSGQLRAQTLGLVPISPQIYALSSEPLPVDRIPAVPAGKGVTLPTCIHCPPPGYSEKARAAKFQGVVILEVVITKEGRPARIKVLSSPGLGLDIKSIEAVRQWTFVPGKDANGNPTNVSVPLEVSFRLY